MQTPQPPQPPYDWATEELVDDLKEAFAWSAWVNAPTFPRGSQR